MFRSQTDHHQGDTIFLLTSVITQFNLECMGPFTPEVMVTGLRLHCALTEQTEIMCTR